MSFFLTAFVKITEDIELLVVAHRATKKTQLSNVILNLPDGRQGPSEETINV